MRRILNYFGGDALSPWAAFLRSAELAAAVAAMVLLAIAIALFAITVSSNGDILSVIRDDCCVLSAVAALIGVPVSAICLYQQKRTRSIACIVLCMVAILGNFMLIMLEARAFL